MNENDYIKIIKEFVCTVDALCDCISDMSPASCDCCPYGDHCDSEECEVTELLNKARKIIK